MENKKVTKSPVSVKKSPVSNKSKCDNSSGSDDIQNSNILKLPVGKAELLMKTSPKNTVKKGTSTTIKPKPKVLSRSPQPKKSPVQQSKAGSTKVITKSPVQQSKAGPSKVTVKWPAKNLTEDKVTTDPNSVAANYNLQNLLSVNMQLIQDRVRLSSNEQTLAVKLSVTEDQLENLEDENDEKNDATIDLFCVVDISGSMKGTKLNEVKQSLRYLLDLLKPQDRISIIIFDDIAELILAPKLIGNNRQLILATIDKMTTRGATNIRAGLETAFNAMKDRQTKNQATRVFLLGDGIDNCWFHEEIEKVEEFYAETAGLVTGQSFTVHTFGYGDGHDENLLNKISEKYDGNFYYVKDLALVIECFVDSVGVLVSCIGKNAEVKINLNKLTLFPDIIFGKTYGAQFTGTKETERTLLINNIYKGFKKDFIFEINLNKIEVVNNSIHNGVLRLKNVIKANLTVENLSDVKYSIKGQLDQDFINEDDPNKDKDLINENVIKS